MKELHIRLKEEEFNHVSRESASRNITISEYIRLLVQSSTEDNKEAKAKLLLLSLSAHKRAKICRQILRRDRRRGRLEPYVEGILDKNPKAKAEEIYKALFNTFSVPVTPSIRKMVRRVKERFKKKKKSREA